MSFFSEYEKITGKMVNGVLTDNLNAADANLATQQQMTNEANKKLEASRLKASSTANELYDLIGLNDELKKKIKALEDKYTTSHLRVGVFSKMLANRLGIEKGSEIPQAIITEITQTREVVIDEMGKEGFNVSDAIHSNSPSPENNKKLEEGIRTLINNYLIIE